MLETKYLGDKLEMLVTDFAIFVINILYLSTLTLRNSIVTIVYVALSREHFVTNRVPTQFRDTGDVKGNVRTIFLNYLFSKKFQIPKTRWDKIRMTNIFCLFILFIYLIWKTSVIMLSTFKPDLQLLCK